MDPTIVSSLIGAAATIAAAFIGLRFGKQEGVEIGRLEMQREIDDAPRRYIDHLDALIATAINEGEGKARVNARAIVSTRNDLRDSMMRISERLNSEIDMLEKQQQGKSRPATLMNTIEVLSKKWPAKKDQIEIELRKVMAEIGLLRAVPKQSNQQDMPPTDSPTAGAETDAQVSAPESAVEGGVLDDD